VEARTGEARLRLPRSTRLPVPGRAAAAYVAYFVAIGAWFPYVPVFYESLGFDLATIGLLAAAAAATSLVAGPAWGTIADTWDRSGRALPAAAILAAAAGAGLWLAGAAVAGNTSVAAVALVLAGVVAVSASMGGVGPQLDARAVASVGGDRVGYGRLRAWGSLSFIVTAALAGRLLDATGPAGLFAVFVPALIATAAVTAALHARRPAADPERGAGIERSGGATATAPRAPAVRDRGVRARTVRAVPFGPGVAELLREPELRSFLLAMFVCWSALNATNAFLSIDLVALGAPANLVGLAWAVSAALEVPIMWAFPALARRFGPRRLLVVAPIVLGLRSLGCALAPTPELLVAVTLLQGVGFALAFVGGVAHVARLAPSRLGATAQGLFGSATVGLGAIVGGGLGGLVASAITLRGLFAVSAAASLLAAALVVRSLRLARSASHYDRGATTTGTERAKEAEWISG
jgi:PPP family 3-phenylpropionic acid transporter